MTQYLALIFPDSEPAGSTLSQFVKTQGSQIKAGDTLFLYRREGEAFGFSSAATGLLKVFLEKEGDALVPGKEVVVLEVAPEHAAQLEKQGLGKILHPEELKELADAASIRLPPEE